MGLPYYVERGIQIAEQDSAKLIIFEIDLRYWYVIFREILSLL